MIAEAGARGRGLGREAICLMLGYGASRLHIRRFEAKIKLDNTPSLALFQKLGFREVSRSQIFEEVTLELDVSDYERTDFVFKQVSDHAQVKQDYDQ